MGRPTDAANAEERIARIEKMVGELGGVEHQARRLAEDMRVKAQEIAAEADRVARAKEIVGELETLQLRADQIAVEVADKAAKIATELAALKAAALRVKTR